MRRPLIQYPDSVTFSRACGLLAAGLLMFSLNACSRSSQTSGAEVAPGGWREFTGTWIASGNRTNLDLGGDRRASIANVEGSLVLAGPAKPGIGFRAQALIFADTGSGTIGRAVWTDEHGNRVYSELKGPGGGKITGTFIGGTGTYAGATGTYEFSWRFLIEGEGGSVQGQSSGLNGRIRVGSPAATSSTGGSQP